MTKGFGMTLGLLGKQYVSAGGNSKRPDQNYMLFQPIVTKIFDHGYFINFL